MEMKDADLCCGFGGSYFMRHPELSDHILGRKLENILASGAGMVAVECPGCLLQIKSGLTFAGNKPGVKHLAEILAGLI